MADAFKEFIAGISERIEGLPETFEAEALTAYQSDIDESNNAAEALALQLGESQAKNRKLVMSFGVQKVTEDAIVEPKEEIPSYDGFFKK